MIGSRLGSYEILEEIGKGGMATVYRAYQPSVDRQVALKVIKHNIAADAHAMERFKREARLVARLEHPHILPIYDFDGGNDPPYIVMRLLHGGTLKDMLARGGFSVNECAHMLRQIASALDYAHQQGIIHRDIKPSNIMIDHQRNAFLSDFGIARLTEKRKRRKLNNDETPITQTGAIIGTPEYMSPEQGLGEESLDGRSDIYALGIVLFQVLTGQLPFTGSTSMAVILKHVQELMPSAVELNPSLPPMIDVVLGRALSKQPGDRYATASELASEFVAALGGGGAVDIPPQLRETIEISLDFQRSDETHPATDTLSTPTEQNKVVTAVYIEAGDYAQLVEEDRGVEVARWAIRDFWKAAEHVVVTHGGQVIVRLDNHLLAVWGVDATSEDDPEQAISAALAVQDALRMRKDTALNVDEPPPLRIGINTGAVLLTAGDRAGTITASGATVSLANRLADNAEGLILISHDTFREVRGVFSVVPEADMRVRGRKEPVAVYRVTGAKARAFRRETRGLEGVETRMIGREAEFKQLQNAFLNAVEDRETQVVTVLSEAGVGKSRLLYEFANWSDLRPEKYRIFRGRATPIMTNRPYALLRDILSFRFEILDSDRPDVVRDKMENGIKDLVGDNPEMAHLIGYLAGFDFGDSPYLKGLLPDPQQLTARARQMFMRLLVGITERGYPVMMQLEDIHNADDATLNLLNDTAGELPSVPMMMVCLARPALLERRPTWGSGQNFHRRIELSPLDKRDSRDLALEILKQVADVPKELRDLLVERAEGNPLYMEELVKMLIEDRVIHKGESAWTVEVSRLSGLRVPPTLAGLLQARLDTLLYPERIALQRASVAGRVFYSGAIRALDGTDDVKLTDLDGILKRLTARGFIARRETSAFAGNAEYIFAQNMLRDAVYNNLLQRHARAYHAGVAQWAIEASGARINEYLPLIAEHYEKAGEAEKAAEFLAQAGERAVGISAYHEALDFLTRALNLLPEPRAEWLMKLGEVHYALSNFEAAREAFEGCLALIPQREDKPDLAARALQQLGDMALNLGSYENAEYYFSESLSCAIYSSQLATLGWAFAGLGHLELKRGRYEEAKQHLEHGVDLSQMVGDVELELVNLNRLGYAAAMEGNLDGARQQWEAGLTQARMVGNRRRESVFLLNIAEADRIEERFAQARIRFQDALTVSQEIGDRENVAMIHNNLGLVDVMAGNLHEARTHLDSALKIATAIGAVQATVAIIASFAQLRARAGDTVGALVLLDAVLNHPAADAELRADTEQVLGKLKVDSNMVEEGISVAETLDFDTIVRDLLNKSTST